MHHLFQTNLLCTALLIQIGNEYISNGNNHSIRLLISPTSLSFREDIHSLLISPTSLSFREGIHSLLISPTSLSFREGIHSLLMLGAMVRPWRVGGGC